MILFYYFFLIRLLINLKLSPKFRNNVIYDVMKYKKTLRLYLILGLCEFILRLRWFYFGCLSFINIWYIFGFTISKRTGEIFSISDNTFSRCGLFDVNVNV